MYSTAVEVGCATGTGNHLPIYVLTIAKRCSEAAFSRFRVTEVGACKQQWVRITLVEQRYLPLVQLYSPTGTVPVELHAC